MPFGIVDETKPGFVKVNLVAEDYKTDWMPITFRSAYKNKEQFTIPVGTQVLVYQERTRDGEIIIECCLGATYNDIDAPPFDSENIQGFELQDIDTLVLHGDETNAVRYDETVAALDEIKTVLNNLILTFNKHVHTGVTTGGGSSAITDTPYTSTITKIMSLIKSSFIKLR